MTVLPPSPDLQGLHLRHVMTSAAAALGLPGFDNRCGVPSASIVVVVLVDGLGDAQLGAHTGHARFLASSWRNTGTSAVIDTGAPTTTAASLASLGTGLTPGEHGLVGYDVLDPELDRVVNMLGRWDDDVDPYAWQPHPTVFTRAVQEGASAATFSRPGFRNSKLTQAALNGTTFFGAESMSARFRIVEEWIGAHRPRSGTLRRGAPDPLLAYVYVDELDKAGHHTGVASEEWIHQLELLDSEVRRCAERLTARYGSQVTFMLTADHGMIDVAEEDRHDITGFDDLLRGVRHTAGEPRFLHLYTENPPTEDNAIHDLASAWEEVFGSLAWVLPGRDAIAAGWFGLVESRVQSRIGDVIVALREPAALFHSGRTGPGPLNMIGQHGSITDAERRVPLLELTGRTLGA